MFRAGEDGKGKRVELGRPEEAQVSEKRRSTRRRFPPRRWVEVTRLKQALMHHLRHLPVEHDRPSAHLLETDQPAHAEPPPRRKRERESARYPQTYAHKEREEGGGRERARPLHDRLIVRWDRCLPKSLPTDSLDLPWLAHAPTAMNDRPPGRSSPIQRAKPLHLPMARLNALPWHVGWKPRSASPL